MDYTSFNYGLEETSDQDFSQFIDILNSSYGRDFSNAMNECYVILNILLRIYDKRLSISNLINHTIKILDDFHNMSLRKIKHEFYIATMNLINEINDTPEFTIVFEVSHNMLEILNIINND